MKEQQPHGFPSINSKYNFCRRQVFTHEDHREKDINFEASIPTTKLNLIESVYQLVSKLNICYDMAGEAWLG